MRATLGWRSFYLGFRKVAFNADVNCCEGLSTQGEGTKNSCKFNIVSQNATPRNASQHGLVVWPSSETAAGLGFVGTLALATDRVAQQPYTLSLQIQTLDRWLSYIAPRGLWEVEPGNDGKSTT